MPSADTMDRPATWPNLRMSSISRKCAAVPAPGRRSPLVRYHPVFVPPRPSRLSAFRLSAERYAYPDGRSIRPISLTTRPGSNAKDNDENSARTTSALASAKKLKSSIEATVTLALSAVATRAIEFDMSIPTYSAWGFNWWVSLRPSPVPQPRSMIVG
jgi:hypothetical protein